MTAEIVNTPSCLIPKEMYIEEMGLDYLNLLIPENQYESLGKDQLENYFLLYPKRNDGDSIHEITVMYNNIKDKFPDHSHAACIHEYKDKCNLLVLNHETIFYSGQLQFSVKEDILYHLAHILLHHFENVSQITVYYKHLSPAVLHLLSDYFEMKQL